MYIVHNTKKHIATLDNQQNDNPLKHEGSSQMIISLHKIYFTFYGRLRNDRVGDYLVTLFS